MPSAALPGGGPAPLITLKTHPPLPSFAIPHRLPDPSIEISSFKLSILRILTGQTNASSSTKPLTFSEQVKEKAINGWKMQMLTLELIQHDDLQSEQHNPPTQQQQIKGFQLQDHHECSLIEQGDMILVRLKQAHAIEELELPELGEAHSYSAPAGSLTRAGTLSQPPPYEIIQPSEPSSFSSSVGAQPNANYHQHRYQDYRSTFRVLTANNVGSGHMRRNTPSNTGYAGNAAGALSQGLKNLQSSSAAGKKDAPKAKRRASATATATAITKPSASPTVDQQHVISPPLSPSLHSAAATLLPATSRNSSSVVTVQANPRPTVGGALGSSSSPNPNAKSGGQFAGLPPTALVIGPGVQGQVGRNPSSVNAPMGASGPAELQYGNASGFVNFTSAGVWKSKPKPSRQASQEFSSDSNLLDSSEARRRPSNPGAAAADAAEKRAALARQGSGEVVRPGKESQVSGGRISKSDLPATPLLPPIQNLAPFPQFEDSQRRRERDLPPMPHPAEADGTMVAVSAATETKPPRLSFLRKYSTATSASRNTDSGPSSPAQELSRTYGFGSSKQPQATAVPLEEMDSAIKPVLDAENHNLTRAERRYLEVQKALQVEREKQAEAEKLRAEEIRALRERKEKERERKESEAKKRAEEQKWEMWEEVRRRQKSGNLDKPLPPGIQRLYSGGEDKGNGGKGKGAAPVAAPAISVATAGLGELNLSSSQDSAPVAAGRNVDAGAASGSRLAAPAPRAALPSDSNGLTGQRIELGLERITLLLSRLKNPHRSFPVIHVAGTNGKGSTIAYLDSLLRNALDIRTGTFVSPHLIERRDCCKVDGRIIDKSIWRQAQSDVLFADQGLDIPATTEDNGQPLKSSPFELLTAQTFQAFSLLPEAERPEVLLIEVGLGGRLDATNVFEESQVLASVICPIDRDHEAFLGSKLEGIAREKAGIVKDGGLCIIADQRLHDPSPIDQLALGPLENETKQIGARAAGILDSIRNVCMSRNARLVKTYIPWKLLSLPPTKQAKWGSSVDFTPKLAPTLFLSTSGLNPPSTFVAHPHDPVMFSVPVSIERTRANLTGVCMTVQTLSSIARDEWAEDRWEDLRTRIMWGLRDDPEANLRVRESLNAVKWAGRCSWFTVGGREVLIDGAHNESSAIALREYIDNCLSSRSLSLGRGSQFEVTYIFAFSEGKDYESMVRAMLENPPDLVERQNVGLTVFSPPEGMPWVRSVEARDALATLKKVSREVDVGELRTFESIKEAIEWAGAGGRTGGSGKGREDKKERGPIVVAGSLYLVADMYRYLQSLGLYTE
ncbi:uncharacterized protein UHO2_06643 [Ustilago hordei]|uniref:Related to tetrahydrofolylpolyglutamate synthase n=1 Tax=Ustilago hordei TaxID=120017 RepID=I2FPH3_USTHO|nr:uncharacterized protein UHO2_06643 [Ustilago hordei]CCF48816.1 related to tetrahydrofolylpolyglutamate synthase [Ustilago hordei]SYW84991.1 related to tetrahydrofolylpolyglutamate synthase [Ustilago hordei]